MTKPGLQANYLYMSNGDTDLYGRYWGRGQIRKYFEQFIQFEGKSVLDLGAAKQTLSVSNHMAIIQEWT